MLDDGSQYSRLLPAGICLLELQTRFYVGEDLKKKALQNFLEIASSNRIFYRRPGHAACLVLDLWCWLSPRLCSP